MVSVRQLFSTHTSLTWLSDPDRIIGTTNPVTPCQSHISSQRPYIFPIWELINVNRECRGIVTEQREWRNHLFPDTLPPPHEIARCNAPMPRCPGEIPIKHPLSSRREMMQTPPRLPALSARKRLLLEKSLVCGEPTFVHLGTHPTHLTHYIRGAAMPCHAIL